MRRRFSMWVSSWCWLLLSTVLLVAPDRTIILGRMMPSADALALNESPSLTSTRNWTQQLRTGYERRVAADPAFPVKSVTEVILAASTQLLAEYKNRGSVHHLLLQADFVLPAVLTAVAGKYMSMYKTAPTQKVERSSSSAGDQQPQLFLGRPVPTNAFQRTMLDGTTVPTIRQRFGSLLAPVVPLFRAGCIASFVGYGVTAVAIQLRTLLLPNYVAATRQVNILAATLYTGCFMAVVSNLRYQLLQGIVEPAIDYLMRTVPLLRAVSIFVVRVGNGILGSSLAIAGMQFCGLQQMRK